jgi:hypothetical protein
MWWLRRRQELAHPYAQAHDDSISACKTLFEDHPLHLHLSPYCRTAGQILTDPVTTIVHLLLGNLSLRNSPTLHPSVLANIIYRLSNELE